MPKIAYERWNPSHDVAVDVRRAVQIANEYASQGYDLTLRQLYYQFVSRAWIPNTERSYKRLGNIVNQARMAGYMDWRHMVDRTRNLATLGHWSDAAGIIRSARDSFHLDWWSDQPVRVEVWVEKEALAGVVQRVANQWDCPWFSCRGYVSQSEMWEAGQRIIRRIHNGQAVVILHLGDHDPSGIDMSRDITDRLTRFLAHEFYSDGDNGEDGNLTLVELLESDSDNGFFWDNVGINPIDGAPGAPFRLHRIALNMDQVRQYNPPPNPAKMTDSRAGDYVERFGRQSWELDALDPRTLNDLIESHITEIVDFERLEARQSEQVEITDALTDLADRPWGEVLAWLRSA